jgi:hypothetical protein
MKTLLMRLANIFSLSFLFFFSVSAHAQYRYELTPSISVSETYDDNLYLISQNEISDYITGVTLGIDLGLLSEKTDFSLEYAPSFVFYNDHSENDTTRHLASLTWGQELTQHVRFDLTDSFYRTEEPLEYDETIQGVRGTREPYWRNTVDAGLEFLFGPEKKLTLGYAQSYLKNEDPAVNDGRIQNPSASLAYWFNERNGIELEYQYTKGDFWKDLDVGEAQDDFTGDAVDLRYVRRFNHQTSVSIRYGFTTRDFEGLTEDYDVQEGSIGFDHSFSPQTTLSLSGGYFSQDRDCSVGQDGHRDCPVGQDGPAYDVLLTRQFERGRFTIGGTGGWYESFLDAEGRGFTKYHSGNANVEYQILERLGFNAGGSYRRDRGNTGREWTTLRGTAEVSWNFLQDFSLSLGYQYADRDDDIDMEDYTSNRVMLSISASRLCRW